MANYKDLLAQIEVLKAQAEEARMREKESGIAEIKALMAKLGITVEDLMEKRGRGAVKGTPAAAKYRDPVSGETWSGRGRSPRWLQAAEAAGQNKESFLIV